MVQDDLMSATRPRRASDGGSPVPSRVLHYGPLPLYHQLEQDLRERISAGEFKPGDLLPTEERICEQYGVSRITVRRALDALIGQGLILRRRGVGSFVAERREGVRSVRLSGSLDEFLSTAGSLDQQVLSLAAVTPPAEVVAALELPAGEDAVRLELVSSLSAGPVIYAELYFPLAVGGVLEVADIAPGLPIVRIIERKLGLRVVRAHQLIEADLASPSTAGHLKIAAETPILRIRRVYYTAGDRPIEIAILRHHPERYQYVIDFRTHAPGY
jgi:GntR family transcriptional regulator